MGQRPPLIINRLDADRLQRLIDAATEKDQMVAELLQDELSHGEIVNPEEIPDIVVSMNSQIQFTDLTRNQQMVRTLVYPHSLGNTEDAISIMAPIGASLLGVKVGDTIDWPLPNQQATRLRVDAILWQPEREKQYHR